jgi:predicted histidine transporter YuiF (NhaC family)
MVINGIAINLSDCEIIKLTAIPTFSMFLGLLWAVFSSYRRPRKYENRPSLCRSGSGNFSGKRALGGMVAVVAMLEAQIYFNNMAVGALVGFCVMLAFGIVGWKKSHQTIVTGFGMMATIGMIMMIASGFSAVLSESGAIGALVSTFGPSMATNAHGAILLMLFVGLLVTMGIGSSFSTVPILATIFVPICQKIDMASGGIFLTLSVAGMLGDAGSVASDSTLGVTAGLDADGQHDHFRDSVIPTFLHFNIPLLVGGYLAIVAFVPG